MSSGSRYSCRGSGLTDSLNPDVFLAAMDDTMGNIRDEMHEKFTNMGDTLCDEARDYQGRGDKFATWLDGNVRDLQQHIKDQDSSSNCNARHESCAASPRTKSPTPLNSASSLRQFHPTQRHSRIIADRFYFCFGVSNKWNVKFLKDFGFPIESFWFDKFLRIPHAIWYCKFIEWQYFEDQRKWLLLQPDRHFFFQRTDGIVEFFEDRHGVLVECLQDGQRQCVCIQPEIEVGCVESDCLFLQAVVTIQKFSSPIRWPVKDRDDNFVILKSYREQESRPTVENQCYAVQPLHFTLDGAVPVCSQSHSVEDERNSVQQSQFG
ncbi:hypothetical protein BV898_07413 [Hypsibius exemplaris]|uniref:Uncharacterized protein n=1 Tax=Hypsibius exemplaris TaxID=2072580 RepID=A0A1W0WTQ3_HYPEX|nr:hypothetical protein BV898_07413 [Hypsibius exemplaris]